MDKIEIYTDGGCSGNPGPGAWAFILKAGKEKFSRYGSATATTNNRMELMAVISAIEFILAGSEYRNRPVEIYTDSQYVKKGITEWIHTWKKNGWLTAAKKPVKNREYWVRLQAAAAQLEVKWHWVLGHAGNPLNEECDSLVQRGIRELQTAR